MRKAALICLLSSGVLAAVPVVGQGNPTGKISGSVSAERAPLPGVTVTARSESLQGSRTTTTTATGDYLFGALPPGEYEITFELEGFQTAEATVVIAAAQTKTFDLELQVSELTESIVVTGNRETLSEGTASSTTYSQDLMEKLPTGRTIDDALLLSPGVHNTGPARDQNRDVISIAGGQTFENLILLNGVVVNENLRGQSLELFIEDAIQETTTSISGVSAEYGRFTGGVVNAVTKSGGNELSGSLRASLVNQAWESENELSGEQEDQIDDTWEATFGGFLMKDRLWFFTAGRTFDLSRIDQLQNGISYPATQGEDRLEGKLTTRLAEGHSLLLSAIDIDSATTNNDPFGIALEPASLSDREDPQSSLAVSYTGVINPSFFVEAQYSERELSIGKGSGATGRGRIDGTNLIDVQRSAATYYIPYFCDCTFDDRNNEDTVVKGSYFLTSESAGSHDIVFGVDSFSSLTASENHQSPSGFSVWTDTSVDRDGQVFPVITPGVTFLIYFPIETPTQGADFATDSVFVNDRWQLDDHWSFNLGLRYDRNDGVDSGGVTVADDSHLSPRLGVSYDIKGDGDLTVNASYAEYVSSINWGVGDITSTAGTYSIFYWDYQGPAINPDPDAADLTTSSEALEIFFDWFDSVGGIDNRDLLFGLVVPGGTEVIRESLDSPTAEELTLGFTKRLGSKGLVRADLVRREYGDFYFVRRDTTTGQNLEIGADVGEITNDSSVLKREYTGLHTQFTYRFTDRFTLSGNYSLSQAEGNFEGESRDLGPFPGDFGEYPEYKAFPEHNPTGDLLVDSRHKLALWAIYDVLDGDRHDLSVSLLQRYNSGQPYGAQGFVDSSLSVSNPGYLLPPDRVDYWFTERDAFETPDVSATDIALNYSIRFARDFELFVQPEIVNIFNEGAALLVNKTVRDATSAAGFTAFDPFAETPVEGVHWELGPNFGSARNASDLQQPRTFRVSVGLRF
jgi:outer membrane receptor protein involved in Fe transport